MIRAFAKSIYGKVNAAVQGSIRTWYAELLFRDDIRYNAHTSVYLSIKGRVQKEMTIGIKDKIV